MAKVKLLEHGAPSNVDYLNSIYDNPRFYSVYVLADVEGNCYVRRSSHAEQNHSSVASKFSDFTIMTLERNVEELCIRHRGFMTQRREQQSK